ncbi:MAG: helix-turn-helix domain-containing protein [Spirochaetales bacterium]|nr:helix-turn-helix domain-containing protein [Spirochaetales bacterium]
MIHLRDIREGTIFFKALGSEIRMEILALISEQGNLNINELAELLKLTKGALTSHIRMLLEAGLIEVNTATGKRGTQKICSLSHDTLILDFMHNGAGDRSYEIELDVGLYFDYSVAPTCGLATADHIIGNLDDPRFFTHPDRANAGILWTAMGFLEYRSPNLLKPGQKPEVLSISMEIGSEAPGINEDWPSDISFTLNGKRLGSWTSPGDFGRTRGLLNPAWWYNELNQYGQLKVLSINGRGSFIDGIQISPVTIEQLELSSQNEIILRISTSEEGEVCGGFTLFGKGFGNYNQGIRIQMKWS